MVLPRLALLFVVVPLAELALLVWIGERVGVLPTLALVVGTGVAGAALARHQGLATLRRLEAALSAGRLPREELLDGALILVAGAFLLTPGILTDVTGFLLLAPPVRRSVRRWGAAWLRRRFRVSAAPGSASAPGRGAGGAEGDVVEAEFEVVEEGGVGEAHGKPPRDRLP